MDFILTLPPAKVNRFFGVFSVFLQGGHAVDAKLGMSPKYEGNSFQCRCLFYE
jgi:hypothetical protein